jgi:exodeoxyribonuclease V beta subunit
VNFHQNLAYEASAGSGKTFALVIRYISLLYLGGKPSNILALTFTNKAAIEMSERIGATLKDLHIKEAELAEISKTIGLSPKEILDKKDQIYKNFLQSDLKISTIDKFFSQILRKFSLHLSLMPDFKIDEQNDEQKFISAFLSEVKRADKYKDLVNFALNESKKLSSIFTLLDDLYAKDGEIKNLKPPIIQSDNKKEILRLALQLEDLFLSCDLLSDAAKKAITVKSVEDVLQKSWIVKDTLEYHYFKKCFTPRADEIFLQLKKEISIYYKNKDATLKSSYLNLYEIYKRTKQKQNISQNTLGFNDVTNSVFKLLRENIDSDFLYFRLDAKIDHILIDEFQDTNVIQYKILEPILDEISSGMGTKELKTLFYVGDIKQSIYRFRGGAKELFHHTAKAYDVTLLNLSTNYRSYANVVKFVNSSFRDKITGYKDQNFIGDKNRGFIKVSTGENLVEVITDNVYFLLDRGIHPEDIAILTYTNGDAFLIEEALLEIDPTLKILTQTTSLLINNPNVKAIIEFLKYLYFKEEIYKANFLTTIGESWDRELDISTFNKNNDLLELVKKIIVDFKLYSDDEAILKFIELILSYDDIESFLFECESLNIESPSKKDNGIQILTIHKSKGLEFDHVIVADRFKKKNADRSSLIFEYHDIELQNLHMRSKNREHFDPEYNSALEDQKRLTREDELNLLYVAFTRAKESLLICQNSENSSFEVLNLQDQEIGTIIKKGLKVEIKKESEQKYEDIKLGLQEQKLKGEKEQKDNFEAIQFGLALHYMLEIIEDFKEEFIDDAYWAMKNRFELYLDEDKFKEIKQRVEYLVNHEPFLKLTNGSRLKEQAITYKNELKQIDLLVEFEDKWVVIDYKSSQKRESSHIAQVLHYKNAIKKITNKSVEAYVCYVRDKEVELVNI